jgi:hypothetical protein
MDNFDLRKFLIENKLTNNSKLVSEQVDEVNWKGLAAGAAMALGTLGAQGQEAPKTQDTIKPAMSQRDLNIQKRQEALKKKEAHLAQLRAEVEARAKKMGFDNVEDYYAWQRERSKGADAGLSGMEGQGNKRGGSCGAATSLQKTLNAR